MSIGRQRKVAYRQGLIATLKAGAIVICSLCGKRIIHASDLTVDHVLPKSKGGTGVMSNMSPAHFRCNQQKGNKIL